MMASFRRRIALAIIICTLPCLSGCDRSTYKRREVEQLLVIQTMGLDMKSGGVLLSLASSAENSRSGGPTQLSGAGSTVSSAIDRISELSHEEDLFCYHIDNIIIGEKAAEAGIADYLSFLCRSPYMRIESPIFVLRGSDASEAVLEAGDESRGICELLQSVRQKLQSRGAGELTPSAGVIRDLNRYGSALVCALELAESAESVGEKKGETVFASGYAIIRDGRLCRFIDAEDAIAVDLLLGKSDVCELPLQDGQGQPAVLEIFDGGSEIIPVWSAPGELRGLEVRVRVSAAVLEISDGGKAEDEEYLDKLTAKMEEELSGKISRVLKSCGELRADFLGLAGKVERASPVDFQLMSGDFPDALPLLELKISVSGELLHSNDLKET